MLKAPAPFPHVGSTAYMDDRNDDGQDIVEKVRIQRDNGDGNALVAIESHRFNHEIASGNRTVPFAQLRETEQAKAVAPKRRQGARR
jgi:hypothetical protein